MEQGKVYRYKIEIVKDSLKSLEESLGINLEQFSEVEADTVKSGQAQKFEVSVELLWKTMQGFINEEIGKDVTGPKPTIKSFFEQQLVDQNEYEMLFEMVEARNKLAHVYDEKEFQRIWSCIPGYLSLMRKLARLIEDWK